ncbi:MAG: helix-hairpin-helix domain-containing protein [Candidatus Thorarchaeota archaeon]
MSNVCHVSPTVAERLFKHFGSLKRILLASESELISVPGIGPITAKRIKSLLGE